MDRYVGCMSVVIRGLAIFVILTCVVAAFFMLGLLPSVNMPELRVVPGIQAALGLSVVGFAALILCMGLPLAATMFAGGVMMKRRYAVFKAIERKVLEEDKPVVSPRQAQPPQLPQPTPITAQQQLQERMERLRRQGKLP